MLLHFTDEKGCRNFLTEQLDALAALVQGIAQRYEIPANAVLDLSDVMEGSITPTSFDWENLHKNFHIGAWPDEEDVIDNLETTDVNIDKERFLTNLALYGYPLPYYTSEGEKVEVIQKVIASF